MGCFFSKKSKRKSDKEERTPTTTTVETATSNAVPLGNNTTDEAPKQYSWDKREKVVHSARLAVIDETDGCNAVNVIPN